MSLDCSDSLNSLLVGVVMCRMCDSSPKMDTLLRNSSYILRFLKVLPWKTQSDKETETEHVTSHNNTQMCTNCVEIQPQTSGIPTIVRDLWMAELTPCGSSVNRKYIETICSNQRLPIMLLAGKITPYNIVYEMISRGEWTHSASQPASPWVSSCNCLCRCPTVWRCSWLGRWQPWGSRRSEPTLRSCPPPQYWSPTRCSHTPGRRGEKGI